MVLGVSVSLAWFSVSGCLGGFAGCLGVWVALVCSGGVLGFSGVFWGSGVFCAGCGEILGVSLDTRC